jgi:hypothetical protein
MLLRLVAKTAIVAATIVWLGVVQATAQIDDQIDWNRAKQIHQKFVQGEKLTEEEQAYHDRAAKALRAKAGAQSNEGIHWKRAQQLHQRFVRGEKLTDEEQAYHDRAARAIRARAGKQTDDGIDWKRAQQLHERLSRGENLTPEEQAYHDRAAKALQAQRQPPPAKAPTGLMPLCDMTAEDRYKGEDGSLYGGGKNEPPKQHVEAAMKQAKLIRPLDRDGKPADDGKIVFISVGMSNTTQEFSVFVQRANADPEKNPKVMIVDGAQGGMDAKAWAVSGKPDQPNSRNPWDVLDERLRQAGVSPQQVQVAWIKQARITPGMIGEFPKHAEEMKGHMVVILHKLNERFPNLRIAYLSSRTYGGYAKTQLNPEPYAYESAFTVRRLIQDQIRGDESLNYSMDKGPVKSPLLLWGPYLWTDGEKGRKADDLVWRQDDTAPDGTHPGTTGRQKVAELLLRFMKTDATAKGWFISRSQ